MKKLFTLICCVTFVLSAFAQATVTKVNKKNKNIPTNVAESTTPAAAENLTLKESEYDFGKIPQGKPVTHIFEFTNTGSKPFALENVLASCGCTTPEWNKEIVEPGAAATIKVGYNAATEGPFNKTVTISYNGSQTKQLIIKGDVWTTPVTSAPENTSLNTLKNEP